MYLYVPRFQDAEYCIVEPESHCGGIYGDSIGRGAFSLQAGEWTRLRQYVQLNSFDEEGRPVRDGILILWIATDGAEFPHQPAIDFRKLVLRTDSKAEFLGIRFESTQGGHSAEEAAPKLQRSYFRNVKLWAY